MYNFVLSSRFGFSLNIEEHERIVFFISFSNTIGKQGNKYSNWVFKLIGDLTDFTLLIHR